ncbi:MAG: hypothetical protein KF789_01420 [Bdellovibrionaceae bacterium]|nr:hypothetical protein [Pseudobdellovibrionaceae bacterium]
MLHIEKLALSLLIALTGASSAHAQELLSKKTSGRSSKGLKMKSSKVPTYEIHKAGNVIPRLDLGEEPILEYQEPSALATVIPGLQMKPLEKRMSPVIVKMDKKTSNSRQAKASTVNKVVSVGNAPDVPAEKTVADPVLAESSVTAQKLNPLSPAESKLLQAQILLEYHDSADIALGLLVDLLENKEVQTEARYTYALAARKLGLHSEFRSILMKIAQESKSKDWAKLATEALVREVEALDISDMKILSSLVDRDGIDTDKNDAYNFYRAKYFLETGDLGQVEDALKYIPEKSKYRADAMLISALSSYRSGNIDKAAGNLEDLLKSNPSNVTLRSIGALTLARIHFQKNRYKEASSAYLKVDRQSPLWLQAMTEQAWTQILLEDHEGAAGNMFSLHTDFFKNAFAPETYTVRSIAYLNLCQYGDGLQVLSSLRKRYGPILGRLEKYRATKTQPSDYYETVRSWLRNSDQKEVDGLPRSFIVEFARHPSFMNVQGQINQFEDELEHFSKANLELIQKEKELLKFQNEAQDRLAKMRESHKRGGGSEAQFKVETQALERQIAGVKMRYELARKARGFIKDARARSFARIEKEKVQLREKASKALKARLGTLVAELTHVLEQNDVLQYEILAGAGEHLRSQSAGAEAKEGKRLPSNEKSVRWDFKGEIWEDEVGHYRSSLKNVCSSDDKLASH